MDLTRQLLGIAAVMALLIASLAWLRRRGLAKPMSGPWQRARTRHLESLDRLSLTPQHSLHLVRMGGRAFLLGRSPAGVNLLASSDWRPEEAQNR
jgi:flagellar biogenesis protein FliO